MRHLSDELKELIQDAVDELEKYRGFSPLVEEGIISFKLLKEIVGDPTHESIEEAKTLVNKMQNQIAPYKYMVPRVTKALYGLSEWLKN